MDQWFLYSLISCFFYSMWAINLKLASRTIDSNTSSLLQLPIRVFATLLTALLRRRQSNTHTYIHAPSSLDTTITATITATIKSLPSILWTMLEYIGNLSLVGVLFTVAACVSTVLGGFYYSDALGSGGDGSAVAVVSGCYPALSYLIGVVLGLEELKMIKVLGVCLAVASCACFAVASK